MAGLLLATFSATAQADDIEGIIETVDADGRSLTVQGITFYTDDATEYDDGLGGFDDLSAGQRVEVDFDYDGNRHIAEEIEREE
jgi:hypothetical protein